MQSLGRVCVLRRRFVALLCSGCSAFLALIFASQVFAQTPYKGIYVYDPAGNLSAIEVEQAPTVSSILPGYARAASDSTFTVQGGNLGFVTVGISDAGMFPTIQGTTGTTLTIGITILPSVTPGTKTITFTNSIGSATATIVVYPKQPGLSLQPLPFTVAADGKSHAGQLTMSAADSIADTFTLSTSDPSSATVTPTSVTIAAGQLTAPVTLTPATTAAGTVYLIASSPTFVSDDMPILIGASADGNQSAFSASVGVINPPAVASTKTTKISTSSPAVGVNTGALVTSILPNVLYGPGSTSTIIFHGFGLTSDMTVNWYTPIGTQQYELSENGTVAPPPATISAAADGTSLTLTIVSPTSSVIPQPQPKPNIPVHLIDKTGKPVPFLLPDGGMVYTGLVPEVSSISPIVGIPGTVQLITYEGFNLAGSNGIAFKENTDGTLQTAASPDILFQYQGSATPDGRSFGTQAQILPTASGKYVLMVFNKFGLSGTPSSGMLALSAANGSTGNTESIAPSSTPTPLPSNVFTVVKQLGPATNPISSPAVGVRNGTTPNNKTESIGPTRSRVISVLRGSGAGQMSPAQGDVGSTVGITIIGAGLNSVQSVTVSPATGVTVGTLTAAANGSQLQFNLTIAANAPQTARRLDLFVGTTKLPFIFAGGNSFLVTAPPPTISEISPNYLLKGASPVTLGVVGANFFNASSAQMTPGAGIALSPPFNISTDGTRMSVTASALSTTPSGAEIFAVTAPGGSSTTTGSAANTITIGSSDTTYGPVPSKVVGVVVGTPPIKHEQVGPVTTRLVTVVNPPAHQSTSSKYFQPSKSVGLLNGPGATGLSPVGWLKGSPGTVTILGSGLNKVTTLAIIPATGVTVSSLVATPDGTKLTATLTIASTAPSGTRRIQLSGASGLIPFTSEATSQFQIAGMPTINSISPIVLAPGGLYTLSVRGVGLADITAVVANPSTGVEFSNFVYWSTDSLGELLTVQFNVDPNAALGSRVIQFIVPGGETTAGSNSANTLSITSTGH